MKTLIFADTHLTEKFDVKLFDYIAPLALKADQIIINGDFWDSYLTSFDQFMSSSWMICHWLIRILPTGLSNTTISGHINPLII